MSERAKAWVRQGLNLSLKMVALGVAIGVVCFLGVEITRVGERIASIWLANGLLVGVLFSAPASRWPGYILAGLIGNFAANIVAGDGAALGMSLATCNTIEIMLAAFPIRQRLGRSIDLTRANDLAMFSFFGVVLAPAISSALAAVIISQSGGGGSIIRTMSMWYPVDALGIAIVAPLILAFQNGELAAQRRAFNPIDRWVAPVLLIGVACGVFAQSNYPLLFLVAPPLLFAVFRHGIIGAATGIALVSIISVILSTTGHGPLSLITNASAQERMLILQAFLAVLCVTAFPVAVVLKQRQRLEAQIRDSETKLRAVADNIPAQIAHIDAAERYLFANAHLGRAVGIAPENIIGKTVREIRGDAAYARIGGHVSNALAGEKVMFELESDEARGHVHFQSNYLPDIGPQGEIRGYYAMTFDITDRKNAELSVAKSEKWLRAITDSIPALISYVDRDERYQFVNAHYEAIFGAKSETFIGKTIRETSGEEAYKESAPHIAAALRGEKVRYERHATEGGIDAHFLIDFIPDRTPDGVTQGFYIAIMDITARKKAELSQAAGEERLRAVTDNLPALISYVDKDLVFRFCNATYEQWFGVPASSIIGRSVADAPGTELFRRQFSYIDQAVKGERTEFEQDLECAGKVCNLHSVHLPHRDGSGKVVGVYTLTSDITVQKKVQQHLNELASVDGLTGLPNRRDFDRRLREALAESRLYGTAIGLLFIDIDHFKPVNDKYGHAAGDHVLKEAALRLKASIRSTDTAARLAGDEFVVILEDLKSADETQFVARKILTALQKPIIYGDIQLRVGASVGIAYNADGDGSPGDLLAQADKALYAAKEDGRNTFKMAVVPNGRRTEGKSTVQPISLPR